MAKRVLLVTFQQALRSLILSLLPVTTVTLLAWAFAGSQTGNTSDPLRASIWFWLAAHLIPFKLSLAPAYIATFFNYLPLGGIVLPLLTLRSSFKRAVLELKNERAARSFITIWYALFATLACTFVQSETVKPIIYFAPIYAAALALLSTINLKSPYFAPARYLVFAHLLLFGVIALVIAFQLTVHFQVVKSISLVVQPGWIGGILLVFLEILYLPNLILATISYISGFGFSIGAGTLVTPLKVKLNGIPAIPILGALPGQRYLYALLFLLIPLILSIINLRMVTKNQSSIKAALSNFWDSIWLFIPTAIFLGYQSGGGFITKALTPFGIWWWTLVSTFLLIQGFVLVFFYLLPQGVIKIVRRNV